MGRNGWIQGSMLAAALLVAAVSPLLLPDMSREASAEGLHSFTTYTDFMAFLRDQYENGTGGPYRYYDGRVVANDLDAQTDAKTGADVAYSETTVQVAGVDEPDIVKTDGDYIYVAADGSIYIVQAYPPGNASLVSRITVAEDVYPSHVFINGDWLVLFGSSFEEQRTAEEKRIWYGGMQTTVVQLYAISDRAHPQLERDIRIDGGYVDARMIGDCVYVISSGYIGEYYRVIDGNETFHAPGLTVGDTTRDIPPSHIYYPGDGEDAGTATHIVAFNLSTQDTLHKMFLMQSTRNLYVSHANIFLTYTSSQGTGYYTPGRETTVIHRISITGGNISAAAYGDVPGRVLDQFSMDEHDGFFRIATTRGHIWGGNASNNIYILDGTLSRIAGIENIAPGERIYSARFMGDKAYLVTFKKVDPFFTINLSDPYDPAIMGRLKIPGYSDYLHPYDDHHIMGIGKDTVEASAQEKQSWGQDFAWYQGLKIALFNVSDFENPQEMWKVVIGDRGTDSPLLHDHKALLFDRAKNLFVIPVRVYLIDEDLKERQGNDTGSIYGEFAFQGAYVYNVTLAHGFTLKGRITHQENGSTMGQTTGWYPERSSQIIRSLYIGDTLYTVSESMIKMNDLATLTEINRVPLSS